MVNAFQSLPFAGLIFFFGLSFFTRNQGLSRFVRFNIQQAILLDIVLIIPSFFGDFGKIFPLELQAMGTNFVFYLWVLVVGYSWANIALGRTPNGVPILSEAAEMQRTGSLCPYRVRYSSKESAKRTRIDASSSAARRRTRCSS